MHESAQCAFGRSIFSMYYGLVGAKMRVTDQGLVNLTKGAFTDVPFSACIECEGKDSARLK